MMFASVPVALLSSGESNIPVLTEMAKCRLVQHAVYIPIYSAGIL